MSLTQAFKKFNQINFNNFIKFKVLDFHVGYVHKSLAAKINSWFAGSFSIDGNNLTLNKINNYDITFNSLTAFFDRIATVFLDKKLIPKITKEYFVVKPVQHNQELFKIERSLLPLFAIKAEGVHLNAYVLKNNKVYIWLAKRSLSKLLYPGKLDNLAAGAVSYGYDAFTTLIKESYEEANIPKALVQNATLAQTLHYLYSYKKGIRNDIMHIYNLELPLDFTPKQNDNEVEEFFLLEASRVIEMLAIDSFKFNSAIAIISFLIEKQLINKGNTHSKTLTTITKALSNMSKAYAY